MEQTNETPAKEGGVAEDLKELAVLTATPEEIEIAGKKVYVGPLKVKQLVDFSTAIQDVMHVIRPIIAEKKMDMMKVMTEAGGQLIKAVAIGCKQPEAWVEELEPDEFLKLASKILVVNVDFFARRLPSASAMMEKSLIEVLNARQAQVGAGPSST